MTTSLPVNSIAFRNGGSRDKAGLLTGRRFSETGSISAVAVSKSPNISSASEIPSSSVSSIPGCDPNFLFLRDW